MEALYDAVIAVLFLALIAMYEMQLSGLKAKWRACNDSLFDSSRDFPVMQRALRARQEQIEEMQDEIDRLRAECVVRESVGGGGQC